MPPKPSWVASVAAAHAARGAGRSVRPDRREAPPEAPRTSGGAGRCACIERGVRVQQVVEPDHREDRGADGRREAHRGRRRRGRALPRGAAPPRGASRTPTRTRRRCRCTVTARGGSRTATRRAGHRGARRTRRRAMAADGRPEPRGELRRARGSGGTSAECTSLTDAAYDASAAALRGSRKTLTWSRSVDGVAPRTSAPIGSRAAASTRACVSCGLAAARATAGTLSAPAVVAMATAVARRRNLRAAPMSTNPLRRRPHPTESRCRRAAGARVPSPRSLSKSRLVASALGDVRRTS